MEKMLLLLYLYILTSQEVLGYVLTQLAKSMGTLTLPTGPTTKVKRYYSVNGIINRYFVSPLVTVLNYQWIISSSTVIFELHEFDFLIFMYTIPVMVMMGEFLFYISHRFMHSHPVIYRCIHKSHHEVTHPTDGWEDIIDSHPIEIILLVLTLSPCLTLYLLPNRSIHVITIVFVQVMNMFLAIVGHTRVDFTWTLFGNEIFSSHFHAGHHAKFKYNYGANFSFFDKLFGTFIP